MTDSQVVFSTITAKQARTFRLPDECTSDIGDETLDRIGSRLGHSPEQHCFDTLEEAAVVPDYPCEHEPQADSVDSLEPV